MTTAEFSSYLRRGLGRAILLLRKEADKTPFRQPLIEHLTKMQDPHRSIGVYDAELVTCFDDADVLAAEIAEILLPRAEKTVDYKAVQILAAIGYRDAAMEAVRMCYSRTYPDYLTAIRTLDDAQIRKLFPTYCNSVLALNDMQADMSVIRQILLDIADLYEYTDCPAIPTLSVLSPERKAELNRVMDEVAAVHPHGGKLYREPPEPEPLPPDRITAEEILSASGSLDWRKHTQLYTAFQKAPADVIRGVAEQLQRQTDPVQCAYLASFFRPQGKVRTPVVFPLDPTPVIYLVEKYRKVPQIPDSDDWEPEELYLHVSGLCRFLSLIRHPRIKALGRDILADPESAQILRCAAVDMMWRENYDAADRAEFADFLKTADEQERYNAVLCLAEGIRSQREGIPEEMIPIVFENAPVSHRYALAGALIKTGRISASMLEECRHDSEPYIRCLAEEACRA